MVMTSLAWTLKSWAALLTPVHPRWKEKHESERQGLLTMRRLWERGVRFVQIRSGGWR